MEDEACGENKGTEKQEQGGGQDNKAGLDNGKRMGDKTQREVVGGRAGEDAIYRTAEASNAGGSIGANVSVEELGTEDGVHSREQEIKNRLGKRIGEAEVQLTRPPTGGKDELRCK